MGHTKPRGAPSAHRWRPVRDAIVSGQEAVVVGAAVLTATGGVLRQLPASDVFAEDFRLLTEIVLAAGHEDFAAALRAAGVPVDHSSVGLADLTCGFTAAADALIDAAEARTDLIELSELSTAEALSRLISAGLGQAPAAEQVHARLAALRNPQSFPLVAQTFFARFLFRYLRFYSSRELPHHLGQVPGLATLADYRGFDASLEGDCWAAAASIDDLSEAWWRRTLVEGRVSQASARAFVEYGLERVVEAFHEAAA